MPAAGEPVHIIAVIPPRRILGARFFGMPDAAITTVAVRWQARNTRIHSQRWPRRADKPASRIRSPAAQFLLFQAPFSFFTLALLQLSS
jgi:hypothetical protein